MKKIAVYVDQNGITASITQKGCIRVYAKQGEEWNVMMDDPMEIDFTKGIANIRKELNDMVEKLKESKVFIAKEISGQLYYILEAHGFATYEAEGKPEKYLNSVWESEQEVMQKKQSHNTTGVAIWPIETKQQGRYYFDLTKALQQCTLSSKQILKPFFINKTFHTLELTCEHVPRWFETDFAKMGLTYTTEKREEQGYQVVIMPYEGT